MSGYASELEAGLDWVLDRHLAQPEPRKPAVVSMSLIISSRSSASYIIAEKVEELIENGIIVVAAAGNFHDGQSTSFLLAWVGFPMQVGQPTAVAGITAQTVYWLCRQL